MYLDINYKTGILLVASLIIVTCIAIQLIPVYSNSFEQDDLLKIYYLGGAISGIFAFLAFFIAAYGNINLVYTNKLQKFETTLFSMLNLQQQITSELIYNEATDGKEDTKNISYKGRELFYHLWENINIKSMIINEPQASEPIMFDDGNNNDIMTYRDGLKRIIESFGVKEYNLQYVVTYFDHYFRHFYNIIKFIDTTKFLNFDEKYRYTSIVRSTLSRYELVWLYYNGLSSLGKDKLKPMLENYCLLKNLRPELLALSKDNNIELAKDDSQFKSLPRVIQSQIEHTTDFFFFISDKHEPDKYYLSVFYPKYKLTEGKEHLEVWSKILVDTPKVDS